MKEPNTAPLAIPPDIAAKCDGPHQFETFDRIARAVITHPKPSVAKLHRKTKRRAKR